MKPKVKTGGKRLAELLQSGKIDVPYLWIDRYNQLVSDIAGTIHCGYVTTFATKDNLVAEFYEPEDAASNE